jgi:hypothetical protein
MQHCDSITAAVNAFTKQLPDPKRSISPAITALFVVKGEPVELIAQKIKGLTGLTWKVYPRPAKNQLIK